MTTSSEENEQKLSEELAAEEVSEETAEAAAESEQPAETPAEDEAAKLAKELATIKDQLLRTMAEYDNHRKRTVKEKEALRATIIADITAKFLPVMDNLERALAAECSDENYKNGVKMISDSFTATLNGLGVEEIVSDGADFDPNLHQAVQRVDSDSVESGKVAQTFAKGYKIGDKVIRFAMVAVAN
ncbi:MAG: nucleotide exchange factor GrpE [Oscillospiraceae bacterium]